MVKSVSVTCLVFEPIINNTFFGVVGTRIVKSIVR